MNIGILTLHFANNYGAVLQVYSLQNCLNEIGVTSNVINYANKYQIDADSLYPIKNGIKRFVKRIFMLPYHKKRKRRIRQFEQFRKNKLNLTKYCKSESDIQKLSEKFDGYIVGSDQVWNPQKGKENSSLYFLNFVKDDLKKIAYAVSIGNAEEADLINYKKDIKKFKNISVRENRGKQVIEKVIDRKVNLVLDPTLLVELKYLKDIEKRYDLPFDKYIFYYSLDGYNKKNRNVDLLKYISDTLQLPIIVVCPEWPKIDFFNVMDAGPEEFLWIIDNATLVCTNSFHGTALSIVLEKNFFVFEKYDGKDDRKVSILKKLGLNNRIVNDIEMLKNEMKRKINYKEVKKLLIKEKKKSFYFLNSALKEQ